MPYHEIHCKHYIHGIPAGTPSTNDLIIRDIYAMSTNDKTKFADWVAYRIDQKTIGSSDTVIYSEWKADPLLAHDERLELDDYRGVHEALQTDYGYFAPPESFNGTPYRYQTAYLSNVSPRKSALNRGPWRKLENKERRFVEAGNVLYVLTGPLFEKEMPVMPYSDESHAVPSGYWKIIIHHPNTDKPESIKLAAYIFPQDTTRFAKTGDHLVTVDEVEKRTGLDVLWELTDDIEIWIESFRKADWL
jgi:endonuclease G